MSAMEKRPGLARVFTAVAVELGSLLLLLALGAWLTAAELLPCAAQRLVVSACVFLSVLIGSTTISGARGRGVLTGSGLCALTLAALMLLGGALNENGATAWIEIFKNIAAAAAAALLSAALQLRQNPAAKKRRRRKK